MNILLTGLFYMISFSVQVVRTDLNNPDIKIALVSKETSMYQVTLYNNSDSVLCILSSAFGKYRKDACDTLSILSNKNYDISYALLDSRFDPFTPLKKKLCILPHQELNFTIRLEELKPNSFLRLQYFYSNDYSLSNDRKETKKPLWYKKYNWKFSDNQIPF